MRRDNCLICNNPIQKVLDLGFHPFADTFVEEKNYKDGTKTYLLAVCKCSNCGHFQTLIETDPADRYSKYDYSYTSSNSRTSREHWTKYAKEVGYFVGLNPGDKVLEIGSNDGFLCEQFKFQYNVDIEGFDASPALCKLSTKRGIKTLCGIFNKAHTLIQDEFPHKYNLIIANNVFNHSDDPLDFLEAVSLLLTDAGTFVFELPYWATSIKDQKFDQIYHEHVSYFTVNSIIYMCAKLGLIVYHIEHVNYHGGSIRVFISKNKLPDETISGFLDKEDRLGILKDNTYHILQQQIQNNKIEFLARLYNIKKDLPNDLIVCIGAAAKANTFLNYYGLNSSIIDFITDSSEFKIGKYTPLSNIPIVSDDILKNYNNIFAIITSWNLIDVLKPHLLKINKNITFLNPYVKINEI